MNKVVAFIFALLSVVEVGLLFVYVALFVPEMSFSDNGLFRFVGLLFCFIVAREFYDYLTDGNGKRNVMIIFLILFIVTLLGFLML